ncbi:MAG: gas vesicle protein [Actinobacteria bacterium]|nr:gas vesicle protein [Actinomycetota bacterium]
MSAAKAAEAGLRSIIELVGKQPEGVTAVERTEDGWLVGVEVLEDQRIPSSADVLALYEADLDDDGTLASYHRVRQYSRGRGDDGGGS